MSRNHKIPKMPPGAQCERKKCPKRATTYNELGELILARDAIYEAVEFVCDRHKTKDPR